MVEQHVQTTLFQLKSVRNYEGNAITLMPSFTISPKMKSLLSSLGCFTKVLQFLTLRMNHLHVHNGPPIENTTQSVVLSPMNIIVGLGSQRRRNETKWRQR